MLQLSEFFSFPIRHLSEFKTSPLVLAIFRTCRRFLLSSLSSLPSMSSAIDATKPCHCSCTWSFWIVTHPGSYQRHRQKFVAAKRAVEAAWKTLGQVLQTNDCDGWKRLFSLGTWDWYRPGPEWHCKTFWSFGSWQMSNLPFAFLLYTTLFTRSVSSLNLISSPIDSM